jgi:hypothetical protein
MLLEVSDGKLSKLLTKSVVGPDVLAKESVALAHPIPMWLVKRGGAYRNKMEATNENVAEGALELFVHYRTVILPALKARDLVSLTLAILYCTVV